MFPWALVGISILQTYFAGSVSSLGKQKHQMTLVVPYRPIPEWSCKQSLLQLLSQRRTFGFLETWKLLLLLQVKCIFLWVLRSEGHLQIKPVVLGGWTSLPHSSIRTSYKSSALFLEQMTPTSISLYNTCQPNSKTKLPTTSKAAVDFTDHNRACSVGQVMVINIRKDWKRNWAVFFYPQSWKWMSRTAVHTFGTRE